MNSWSSRMELQDWVPFGYTEKWNTSDKYMVGGSLYSGQKPVRMGIVGLGGVSQGKHLPAILRLGILGYPVEIISVCDITENAGEKIENLFHAKWYSNYEEMLKIERLDAVEVLIPSNYPRAQVIENALLRGIHVLTEKPLMFTKEDELLDNLKESKKLCELAEEKNLVLSVAFSKRFSPPYANAKKLLCNGMIGKISMVAAKMCQGWSKTNLLENQACHIIDILRFLVGADYKNIYARGINAYEEKDYSIDGLVSTIEFQNETIGALYVNSSNPSLKPWERVEIFGEKKWLSVEDGATLTLYDSEEGPSKTWEPVWPNTLVMDAHFSGFVGEITAFLEAVRGNVKPATNGWDGYKALEVAYAMHISHQEKKEVHLPIVV